MVDEKRDGVWEARFIETKSFLACRSDDEANALLGCLLLSPFFLLLLLSVC